MPAMRALGSMSRDCPIVVPVLLWAQAASAPGPVASALAVRRLSAMIRPYRLIPPSRSFHDRELADVRPHARRIHVEDVESGGRIQVVLGAQIPRHVTHIRAVLTQGLHEISAHGVNADGRILRHAAE